MTRRLSLHDLGPVALLLALALLLYAPAASARPTKPLTGTGTAQYVVDDADAAGTQVLEATATGDSNGPCQNVSVKNDGTFAYYNNNCQATLTLDEYGTLTTTGVSAVSVSASGSISASGPITGGGTIYPSSSTNDQVCANCNGSGEMGFQDLNAAGWVVLNAGGNIYLRANAENTSTGYKCISAGASAEWAFTPTPNFYVRHFTCTSAGQAITWSAWHQIY